MFDVFETMRQAQGVAAFDNLARLYGLSPEQMRAATAAVSPAFAQAFQRRSEGEQAAERLSRMLGAENYARAFDMQAAALDAAAKGEGQGDAALSALFGSPEVSRAVAAQASAASGVQAEIIRKVLPVLASVLIGGMMKALRAQAPNPAADYWRDLTAGASPFGPGAAQEEKPQPKEAATGPRPDAAAAGSWPESATTGMGGMMTEMLNGMFAGLRPAPEPAPEQPAPPPPEETEDAHAASFDAFLEGSREWQAENAKAMEQIFDAFWGGAKKG